LDHGEHPDGRRYLVTERIRGVTLKKLRDFSCSRPEGLQHMQDIPCTLCSEQAYSNALRFVTDDVLPQLTKLKSKERGINGFVMPPSWLAPDCDAPWKGKKHWKTLPQQEAEYVFQHGDLAAHNIMMDPKTLQVKALIDWEYAGYFPAGMEQWPGTLDEVDYRKRGAKPVDAIAQFLAEDYVESYESWGDKDELNTLIKAGELPDPQKLQSRFS
jgi:hypothetical protein